MKKEPNFIIAGGVATGTSFLSHSIKDHSQIYLPKIMRPECGFFYKTWDFNKGKEYYCNRWFHEVQENHIAIGERSSLYLHGIFNQEKNDVAKKIYQMYPDIKLIFCLRNPTERAYANYRFSVLSGFETLPFREAIEIEERRIKLETGWMKEIQPHIYKQRGLYYKQLEPFLEFFPKEQILFIKSEVLSKKTDQELKKVYRFLEIDENFIATEQENFSSPNVKNAFLQSVYRNLFGAEFDIITEKFRSQKPDNLIEWLVYQNLTEEKQPMNKDDREYLNDYYSIHNEKLVSILGWDLSDWK